MIEGGWPALTLTTGIGCGLMAGSFFAFSSFVMPALGRLPPGEAVAAMQAVNVVAERSWFVAVFLGTAGGCLVLAVASLREPSAPARLWRLAGCAIYLGGALGVTVARSVPLNNALARLAPHSAEAAGHWAGYLAQWTAWNHVRTTAAAGAACALMLAAQAGE